MTAARRIGSQPPVGYRWHINPRPSPQQLHLSVDGKRTLCDWRITRHWVEPSYTQRTKCRPCWLAWAAAVA